ncbi:RagB/SusD family nutrient uptake outer membrane protein [Spirosoma sp. BT702]|uniref:RagB/SusD family nutrient uptake outer membrane protein n=1 Tax=Spirosoma profusum TaxID=2771354 RepID=A0A927AWC9_9BACT|nr:RagB/SusD family nutrient uptake outer membrane protein [Spirosoma profusum]MBD2705632.1 RagB/SusD family nutrient uptake outer membrane protein [Spirosoma profusum]
MKTYIILGALLLTVCQGCKETFLEENPRSVLNPVNFYTDETGLNAGINATYASMRSIYGEREEPFRLTLLGTDVYTNGKGQLGLPFDIYDTDLNPFAAEVDFVWSTCYKTINLTNTLITSAEKLSFNEQRKARIIAEAKFFRALNYFWLVQLFGDVPQKLDPTTGVITEAVRTPQAEVYKTIVDDLKYAETNLAATYPQWGRIRKGAVQHLLSKVYLVQKDWTNAADMAKKVIQDQANYKLEEDYTRIFHWENQVNKEIIYSVQYENDATNSGSIGNQGHLYFQNSYSDIPGMQRVIQWGRPFSRFAPTPYLMKLFDKSKDERTDIWRTFDDYYYNNPATLPAGKKVGDPIDESWRDKIEFHWTNLKYFDPTRPNVNEGRGNKDFIVFRLGETYLIAAEALMMAGKNDEAVTYFNEIRRRAARPGVNLSVSASALNIDLILEERGKELAGEMDRWFDLVRTGKAVERVKAYSARGQNIKATHVLRPIPQTQIDRVTIPFTQNPGY